MRSQLFFVYLQLSSINKKIINWNHFKNIVQIRGESEKPFSDAAPPSFVRIISSVMIKKLDENFEGTGEVEGFEFRQIKRGEKALLHEVYGKDFKHFEVFVIKTAPICLDFDNHIYSEVDSKEYYPKAKDFGIWAWTTGSILRAVDYFDALNI